MPNPLISNILNSLNTEVLGAIDLCKSINHPGESGRAREQILADFFRRLLPRSFSIDTGFVIDATGGISRQVDIVIYRNDYHPVFEIGGLKHFLVESVAVVMENKASIANTTALKAALENIKSVKSLDRTNRGENYTLIGTQRGDQVNPDNFQHQVFGAILTEQSLSRDTLRNELLDFLRSNHRNHWPNFYADVRNLSAHYIRSVDPNQTTVIPSEARFLGLTDKAAENFVPPLIELAFEIVNFLRVTSLVDFHPTSYLLSAYGKIDWWKIETEAKPVPEQSG